MAGAGRWAWVDLTNRRVRVEGPDEAVLRDFVGGRGVQARLIFDHLLAAGPIVDPLGPANRVVIGNGPLNDTPIPSAGRGSCSFISPMTRSPEPSCPWLPPRPPLHGLLTHASAGGIFANMLKRAGFDQIVIDGRAERPVRLLVNEDGVAIADAEDELFEVVNGARVPRRASAITDRLNAAHPASSTVTVGPAGWSRVAFACLTADHHRNFGRGGAGAVFASKNLLAITAHGRRSADPVDPAAYDELWRAIDAAVQERVADPAGTSSFRPTTGTTWWLDRAFNGRYNGRAGGYLPWHNFDEGFFEESEYARVNTEAFLAISGRHRVCNRCRHIMCTRSARVESGPFAGDGVRPEFETIALWINCCLVDRDAIFHLNRLANDLGIDTMTFGSVAAAAMDLAEQGFLSCYSHHPKFGSAGDMVHLLEAIAYGSDDLGRLLASHSDNVISELVAGRRTSDAGPIARAVTTAFGGLGYAGIEPKAFPGMFAAYATSNRGRGDHTYAWTVQAEESGLAEAEDLGAAIASAQIAKALVDSLGLCDFFPDDIFSDRFIGFYRALTGRDHSPESLHACGHRIYNLERAVNAMQGRTRCYDAYIPPKLLVPLTNGALAGRAVDTTLHEEILDACYRHHGWNADGTVSADALA